MLVFIKNNLELNVCRTFLISFVGKESILQFLATTNLQSIRGLTAHEQYTKVRTKLFNDRKTVRAKTATSMKKMSGTK